MATQDTVKSLAESVLSNPDFLSHLTEHPYSAVREASGKEEVSREEVSEAVTALSALMGGQNVDFANLGSMSSGLLEQNGGSAHDLASSLFGNLLGGGMPFGGGEPAQAASGSQADILQGLMSNLSNVSFEQGMAGVDLSDGLGIDDVIGFAKGIFGK